MNRTRWVASAALLFSLVTFGSAQTTISSWEAAGPANAAWGIAGSGGSWMSMVGFTANTTSVVGEAGLYLYQGTSSAYTVTYQLWSSMPNRINLNAAGQPGYLGSATVSGSGMSTTNGQLVTADFTAQNITLNAGSTYYLLPLFDSGGANWNMTGTGNLSAAAFYNTDGTGSLTSASWVANQSYKDVGYSVAAPIPEPSTYAALFGALALGAVALRRRRAAQAA
jgi:hypothetical protein